ncbi:hypothetical protein GQ53DRAFT_800146 [Thozetella sp. PMI_491]|nr:hypothetical protein GQ53DRAFT_800146 [Thozetella sp. PMI_491]
MTAPATATAHLRVARPTNNIEALLPFYCDGLGFEVLGQFDEHEGFDGILLGHKGMGYHLEFTRNRQHDAGRAPTLDNLLVFYLPDAAQYKAAVSRIETAGFVKVQSFNPYWDRYGNTYEDPDGYRAGTMRGLFGAGFWLLSAVAPATSQQTGNHPEWDRWCGKVYKPGFPSFDPGGQTVPPTPAPNAPLLYVQLKPRYSLYLAGETQGEFVVNAELSSYFGQPWTNASAGASNRFVFSINLVKNDDILVENKVTAGSTGNVFAFDLSRLAPSLDPIQVVLYGAPEGGNPTWTATTEVYYLPDKKSGSVARLDNLNGGVYFKNAASGGKFQPLLPYGFFGSYDGFLADNQTSTIQAYADLGLNAMTPLTLYRDEAPAFAYMDKINLKFQYDLRDGYKNLTYVEQQVTAARDAEALFSYWTADEPDGWQDPFNGTVLARDLIRKLDPYHPVAVVLNCQNFYFKEYTAGADIIMTDPYPIGINSTFSKWGTACNTTLGDCGCDNCQGNVQDVSRRFDDFSKYERWLGLWPKTKIFNPQSFHGEDYWFRDPSPEEEYVMGSLALNHGAQGLISWVWPASNILGTAHGAFAKVITASPVLDFLVGGDRPHKINATAGGSEVVDAAYWTKGKQILVVITNGGYVDLGRVEVPVSSNATLILSTPWGSVQWSLGNSKLAVDKLPALATSIIILETL